mmetsp:Transcript_2452/g.3618  ORF Transcript_2452/g.3618 Transcript_2452/m.3618 type:complete len:171 (-) Transcript_2452:182-694(-)
MSEPLMSGESTTQYQQYREEGGNTRDPAPPSNSILARGSSVINGGANKVRGWNRQYRIIERTNNALKSAGESLKRWDERVGIASRFNNAMERNGQKVNQWDENNKIREKAAQAAASKLGNVSQRFGNNSSNQQQPSHVEMGYVNEGYAPPVAPPAAAPAITQQTMPQALT